MSQDVSFQKSTKVWFSMTTGILKSLNPRNRNSISVISTKFLFVSSMNTLLATLKVTDARRDVILTGGLNHRFPWRPSPTPGSSITWYNAKLEIKYPSYSPSVNLNIGQVFGPYIWASLISVVCKGFIYVSITALSGKNKTSNSERVSISPARGQFENRFAY